MRGHNKRGKYSSDVFLVFHCFCYMAMFGLSWFVSPSTRGMWNELSTYVTLAKLCTLPVSFYEVRI